MKIICVMVQSVNGKITRDGEGAIHSWISPEDQRHFTCIINELPLIVMGRETYEAAAHMMRHGPGKIRIVLTSTPKQFSRKAIPGQLEFRKDTPCGLVQEFDGEHDTMLLVGGGVVNAQFFDAGLVDELYLTVEPVLFGSGHCLVQGLKDQVRLELLSVSQLNHAGTLLLHYRVERPAPDQETVRSRRSNRTSS